MSLADHQPWNVPIHYGEIVPKDELAHTPILSKRISKKKIEELAIEKYRTCSKCIDFFDLMKFTTPRPKTQRILKDCLSKESQKKGSYMHQFDLTRNCGKLVICYSHAYTIMQNVLLRFAKLYHLAK